MMRRLAPALLLGLVLALPATDVHAESEVHYGPLPDALATLEPSGGDRALIATALEAIRSRRDAAYGRALLIMLGDDGLAAAGRALGEGSLAPEVKRRLLSVVAAARHPAADRMLDKAGVETRPLYRMLAAHGLGRGRTPFAIDPLTRLARDPLPAVRIAALRSLFAIPSPAARSARGEVPVDPVPALHARRLAWHARARDGGPRLLAMAEEAYRNGSSAELRMAAAHYLTDDRLQAPIAVVEQIVREMGGGAIVAWLARLGMGARQRGYDPVVMRTIAIRGMFTLLGHSAARPDQRERWLRWAVAWVAHPVRMNPYSRDPIPEFVLRRRLPDEGAEIIAPVVDLLERHAFDDPRKGMVLLRELGADLALEPVKAFLAPRAERPPYESDAEAQQRRYLRGAAAGVLQELGRVGDEALARALLFGDEPQSLKVDIVHALDGDDSTWAVPVLVRLMREREHGLRQDAILALERRDDPAARAALVEDLFERMERVHDRLRPLVRRGDEEALAVMKRALADERAPMRKAALAQFHRKRNPRLCRSGKDLVLGYEPDMRSRQEIQAYLYALLSVAPERAVAFVDERWDAFPKDDVRHTCVRMLAETTGKAAREAAMDLALRRMPAEGAPRPLALASAAVFHGPAFVYDWRYRADDIGARFRAWLDGEDVPLQREAITAWTHAKAPEATARLVELLTRARAGKALAERDSTHVGEQAFAASVLDALVHQPWDGVEATFVDVALDRTGDSDLARVAAYRMVGRISEATRTRLSTWLGFDDEADASAPGRKADRDLQLFLAAAVGTEADDATAARLQRVLERELWAFFSPAWLERVRREGPGVLTDRGTEGDGKHPGGEITSSYDLYTRVGALARAVASTRHEPSILATLELVFDARLATFARECVRRESVWLREAGATAAAIVPSELNDLGHRDATSPRWGMPLAVYEILREAKIVEDDKLAATMERVLARARADGRLARFPLLYLVRVLENQLEPRSGRNPKTADVLWRYGSMFGEGDTPLHYWLRQKQVDQLAEARRFDEAAAAQRAVVRTLVRGNHTATIPDFYDRAESLRLALEGAALARRGEAEDATVRFHLARQTAPDHPDVLNTVAWYRALAEFGLEDAEAEALRATRLEARVENRPGVNAADTLAYVLLLRERPMEGLRLLAPRVGERGALFQGFFHYRLAQLNVALGRLRSGRDALVEALVWDRALIADVKGDRHLAPLLEKTTLEDIRARAAMRRFEEQIHP